MEQKAKQVLTQLQQCVGDAEVDLAFEGILCANHSARQALHEAMMRVCRGYAVSNYCRCAMHKLGLIRKPTARGKMTLSAKGLNYLGLMLLDNLSAHSELVMDEGSNFRPTAVKELVTDSECRVAVANANYGEWTPRQVVNRGVLSLICRLGVGHTQWSILSELGLANGPAHGKLPRLTRHGVHYLQVMLKDRFYRHLQIALGDSSQ